MWGERNHLAENKATRKRRRTGTDLAPAAAKTTQKQEDGSSPGMRVRMDM